MTDVGTFDVKPPNRHISFSLRCVYLWITASCLFSAGCWNHPIMGLPENADDDDSNLSLALRVWPRRT
ncbi:MAG: hypothetical protein RIF32_16895 [Leptospirales bacterium]